ncbi:MAG TPA: hypothetical protein VD968_11020 [Pyrinomonadaceae bacterium]|nr:hypothetical protein [Pyrinomonadaceae bacterium]
MSNKTEILNAEQLTEVKAREGSTAAATGDAKKKFTEPEVSFPIDVLEATTFFQGTDSGVSNP